MHRVLWIVLIVIVLGLGAFLVSYSFKKARPDIPADDVHTGVRGQQAACLVCHGPGGASPRSANHPPVRGSCEQCHYLQGEPR